MRRAPKSYYKNFSLLFIFYCQYKFMAALFKIELKKAFRTHFQTDYVCSISELSLCQIRNQKCSKGKLKTQKFYPKLKQTGTTMIESSVTKHTKSDHEKQMNTTNIFKANEPFFKDRKDEIKSRFARRNPLKTVNPPKINLSDSLLNFSDSTGLSNEKFNSSSNNFRLKRNKFKAIRPENDESSSNSISKWPNQLAPIRGHEAKMRENTNFSIKIAYDNLFASRLEAITPHTYLDLDIDPRLALARENTIKNMKNTNCESFRLSRQKTILSPEIYSTIQRPRQNLYTELILLDNLYKKNAKRPTPPKTFAKKKYTIKQSIKKDKQVNNGYESFEAIESSLASELGSDIRTLSLREAHNLVDLTDVNQSSESTLDSEEKKLYQKSGDLSILEGLANTVKFKEALKDSPFDNLNVNNLNTSNLLWFELIRETQISGKSFKNASLKFSTDSIIYVIRKFIKKKSS
ncbi:hypothetical protein BpHYR1_016380 [Brachionus plicatilis]|uniref:Uncharacterized protein n=1 Tax=Brachionus plicatilis TaxID=10195 RepID=A0A3M7SX26_BRAPC|nr:hypothetical protein BpHYR1_016380 [Brachionus plicatilis]